MLKNIFTFDSLIGSELGLMKDELNGATINEAYFLGIKQYGYSYFDKKSNKVVEKSVFAGVDRNSMTLNEIKFLFEGGEINRNIESRFFKSIHNLNITIKPTSITINKYLR